MAQVGKSDIRGNRKSLSTTVLKTMSLFGGLQVAQILCSAIRMKLVAWLIGPAGMGLFGIFNNMVEMIGQISGLGMRTAAVRDVVDSRGQRLAVIAAVIRRWGVALGIVGAILTLALAPVLSRFYFGDNEHILGISMLASVLFLTSVLNSEQAIMQGTKHLNKLAVSSLWGAIGGLVVSIPMFVLWRINSIVPSIIAYALITCIAALICRVPTGAAPGSLTLRATFDEGKQFITLGFFMTIAVFVEMLSNNIFLAYLNTTADTDMVGYYQSGYTLFNRYIGLVFAAIAMEYYPRLTQVRNSPYRTSLFVSHELSLVTLVLVPIIGVFITGAELIVKILYTNDFMVIIPFMVWGITGTVLRAYSWCVAMTILAKGDGRIFVVTESFSAISGLVLNVLCYHQWGLTGLGWAYTIWYAFYSVVVSIVYVRRYGLSVSGRAVAMVIVALLLSILMAFTYLHSGWIIPLVITAVVSVVSLRRLIPMFLARR